MRLAFTIGAYRLHDFIKLGICQIQKLSPESPILVSDDQSKENDSIRKLTDDFGCSYTCSRVRKGHFSADFQSIINALVFAKAAGADVAIKVSQRFIFRKPEAISVIHKLFEDPAVMMATPGRPIVTNGGRAQKGFAAFSILTDVIMLRVGSITPEDLLVMYRSRILREKVPWSSFIECTMDELCVRFGAGAVKVDEFTNQPDPLDPIYLRRYQNTEQRYRDLALSHGWNGQFPISEWGQIEQRNYMCKPMVI